jgi:hypothetical protein
MAGEERIEKRYTPPGAGFCLVPVQNQIRYYEVSKERIMPKPQRQLSAPLSELQLELLKLYSTDMTTEELLELKQELARFFARKAVASADRLWDEKGMSAETMDAWLGE